MWTGLDAKMGLHLDQTGLSACLICFSEEALAQWSSPYGMLVVAVVHKSGSRSASYPWTRRSLSQDHIRARVAEQSADIAVLPKKGEMEEAFQPLPQRSRSR